MACGRDAHRGTANRMSHAGEGAGEGQPPDAVARARRPLARRARHIDRWSSGGPLDVVETAPSGTPTSR